MICLIINILSLKMQINSQPKLEAAKSEKTVSKAIQINVNSQAYISDEFCIQELYLMMETLDLKVPVFPEMKKPSYQKPSTPSKQEIQLSVAKSIGPSKNYFFSPSKLEETVSLSTKLSFTSGSSLNYIVNNALQTIKKHIGQPTRAEVEGQLIRNMISHVGKLLYMLHMEWASVYTDYLQRKINKPPGPINNTAIFCNQEASTSSDINFKINLAQDQDFVLLNRNTWLFVHQLYGGGPEVALLDYLKETQGKRIQDLKIPEEDSYIQNSCNFNNSLSRMSSAHSLTLKMDSSAQSYISINFPFSSSRFELPPVGFYNESNFCFMNAGLQGLLTIEQLNCWAMNEGKSIVGETNNAQERFSWVYSLVELVLAVSSKKSGSFLKIQGLKNLTKKRFDPRYQHDSQEFLRYMIEELNQELKGLDKNYQTITDILFQGKILSLLTCQNGDCKNTSTKLESFLDLSVPMQNHVTLDDCLKEFFSQEMLSDKYKCQNCQKLTRASKRYVIGTPPTILMIHLKRFAMFPTRIKLHGHLSFPVLLNMQDYCSDSSEIVYRLRSVIVHYGTPERGHYVTFSSRQNMWYYFDDHKIYSVTEMDILEQQAYVLFYERYEELLIQELIDELKD